METKPKPQLSREERKAWEGKRVELHPGCDLWMRGAKYGEVRGCSPDGILSIRMDHPGVKRLQYIPIDRVLTKETRNP